MIEKPKWMEEMADLQRQLDNIKAENVRLRMDKEQLKRKLKQATRTETRVRYVSWS